MNKALFAIALFTVAFAAPALAGGESKEVLPPGVEQIIPRGTLKAINEPVFVSAAESGMPDEQWILGIEIEGEAHAYDLNLLNSHEVVNDVVGGKPVSAVW